MTLVCALVLTTLLPLAAPTPTPVTLPRQAAPRYQLVGMAPAAGPAVSTRYQMSATTLAVPARWRLGAAPGQASTSADCVAADTLFANGFETP